MKNFVIFFNEKEGTSPLVRLLDNFENVSVVHQVNNSGWEPFDRHNCGAMKLRDLEACLDLVFGNDLADLDRLNSIYTRTAKRPLESFDESGSVGFKMRFRPASMASRSIRGIARRVEFVRKLLNSRLNRSFRQMMFQVLRRHGVVAFIAVRQDIFRWAISKYRGGGFGKRGHLQFELADGNVDRENIPSIRIECDKFNAYIEECEQQHANKRKLANELREHGIEVHPLRYEDFMEDKRSYFHGVFEILGIDVSDKDIDAAINKGSYFKKVHSHDISEFVINHQEVTEKFGTRFEAW